MVPLQRRPRARASMVYRRAMGPGAEGAERRQRPGFDIPSLDGIRAVSFLIVFAGHALPFHIPARFGVTVFFFLSGFLITTLMRREAERSGKVDFRAFYTRRALRILPPFYLVLAMAIAAAILHVTKTVPSRAAEVALALHFSNY